MLDIQCIIHHNYLGETEKAILDFESKKINAIMLQHAYANYTSNDMRYDVFDTSIFKDKIIVVTGSTQGSGAETAKLLARRGAKGITICGRNEKKGKKVLKKGKKVLKKGPNSSKVKRYWEKIFEKFRPR